MDAERIYVGTVRKSGRDVFRVVWKDSQGIARRDFRYVPPVDSPFQIDGKFYSLISETRRNGRIVNERTLRVIRLPEFHADNFEQIIQGETYAAAMNDAELNASLLQRGKPVQIIDRTAYVSTPRKRRLAI